MKNSKDFELVSNCIQPGAASLLIELSDGCITADKSDLLAVLQPQTTC